MKPNVHLKFILSKNAVSEFICCNIPEKKYVEQNDVLEIQSLLLFSKLEAENQQQVKKNKKEILNCYSPCIS